MFRDRIRVRPAASRSSYTTPADSDNTYTYAPTADSASSFAPFASDSQRGDVPLSTSPYAEDGTDALRYARRIAQLAYDTVGSVFGAFRARGDDAEAYGESKDAMAAVPQPPAAYLSSPAVPPNTPYTASSTSQAPFASAHATGESYRTEAAAHPSDTIERRRPRATGQGYDVDYSGWNAEQRDHAPRTENAIALPRTAPAREAPQYQITVNQYFAAPQHTAYPVVATMPEYASPRVSAAATGYQPRVSLLTVPSTIRPPVKRERSRTSGRPAEAPAAKKAAPARDASDVSLSNAPSAIPLGSAENSLTVPISLAGSGGAPLFSKAKAAEEPAMTAGTAATAPLFGAKTAAPGSSPFMFGVKPATTTAATTTSTSATTATKPATSAPSFGSFVKQGPPAVIADDDGFAPNAGDDEDNKEKTKAATAPAKTGIFSSASSVKPAFSGFTTNATAAAAAVPPANPFSFSPKPTEKTSGTTSTTTAVPSATPATSAAPKVNSFVKPGPTAVMPDDDGFAPGADSDDDKDNHNKESAKAEPPKPLAFSFKASGAAPAFGSGSPSPTTTAPLSTSSQSPFTFTTKAADAAPPRAAPAPATSFSNSFVKAGPPAVIADDDGFAPNADSDEDGEAKDGAKKARQDSTAPATAAFSFTAKPAFGTGGMTFGASSGATTTPSFGTAPTSEAPANLFKFSVPPTSEAPANPFKFTPAPTTGGSSATPFGSSASAGSTGASPFGSGASTPFGTGASSTFTFGKSK